MPTTTIYTIGHSTRPIDEFIGLLQRYAIAVLADIRTVPKSRHNPQYEQNNLRGSLEHAGIEYRYLPGLGGLRRAATDSVNTGWRNASFRGYADYMQTDAFAAALDELIAVAVEKTTAMMCAEAVPWRCHRSLVADALLLRDIRSLDVISGKSCKEHMLTRFARAEGLRLTYPPPDA